MAHVAAAADASPLQDPGEQERKVRWTRRASLILVIVALWGWDVRTTGTCSWTAFALLAGFVLVCAAIGLILSRECQRVIAFHPGIAFELLVGFFACNTALFVLTLASPLGMTAHVALLAIVGIFCGAIGLSRRHARLPQLQAELGSLACIAFTLAAATLWVRDQQPITSVVGDTTVFHAWGDLFIHVREIAIFAHANGMRTVEDIRLAGVPASVYHYASYMMPAALDALTPTSALDAYAAFQLPFGIFLMGVAAYVLTSVLLRTTWPAVVGSAALLALPDADAQGIGMRLLSFPFMTQVNLGMLYGLACISLAWMFMIEGCWRSRPGAIGVAYLLLVTCLAYKAHLFVANALLLMLYPCFLLEFPKGRLRWFWRVIAAAAMVGFFAVVVTASQSYPRVPTLRFDASGLGAYTEILLNSASESPLKHAFDTAYHHPHSGRGGYRILATLLVLVGSFGMWIILAPAAYWMNRSRIERGVAVFVAAVIVNYMVMSTGLAMDEHGVGSREEFLNRPHAWAYFVVVAFSATGLAMAASRRRGLSSRRRWPLGLAAAGAALFSIDLQSAGLETLPQWGPGYATYAEINAAPNCLVRAARHVHDNGAPTDVVQDSRSDPNLVFSGIAERRSFVSLRVFGNDSPLIAERVATVEAAQRDPSGTDLVTWAKASGVDWLLLRPEDSRSKDPHFLGRAVLPCDGFFLFHFEK